MCGFGNFSKNQLLSNLSALDEPQQPKIVISADIRFILLPIVNHDKFSSKKDFDKADK